MKGPTSKEEVATKLHELKCGKQKRVIGNTILGKTQTVPPTTFEEAKASCKARKRKERQESISSLCQERKVIRSNSEERPIQKKHIERQNSIRRVSSSEDFQTQRSTSSDRNNAAVFNKKNIDKSLVYDDCEHEKRRSHERFARPLALRSKKHPTKRLKVKCITRGNHKKLTQIDSDESRTGFLQLHIEERDTSPIQELVSPVLDWSTLHEQIDCSEPVLSYRNESTETIPVVASNRLLSSPRNSIIATHRIYLDPDVPKVTTNLDKKPQTPIDERLHKIAKQINSIKKKVKKYEADFEAKHSYKPSHYEKMADKHVKMLYTDLNALKKEQKQLTELTNNGKLIETGGKIEQINMINLQETITEIEKKLSAKREAANRGVNIEEMSSEQLVEEKIAVQRALLFLESIHGRPNTKEDRDVVRPFYDRYRTLKRMVAKLSMTNLSGNELATIHENETMNFVTPTSSSQSNDTDTEKTTVLPSSTDSDTDSSIGDNLHSLNRHELIKNLATITEEKKELKRIIKEFELEVQLKTGRMIQRDDKAPMENVYLAYKKLKAKTRLLEALVGKLN